MRPIHFVRTVAPVIAGLFLISLPLVAQPTQEPSIADAARANREQKKTLAQPGKVVTNDSLSPSGSASTALKTTAEPPAGNASSDEPAADQKPAAAPQSELSPADQEKLKAQISSLKQQLKEEQSEVELQKHLVELDKEAYFSQTDFARDTQGKAKLDAEQDDLKQKEEAFETLKAKLLGVAPQEALTPPSAEQNKP